jgi:hypothetical protein
LTVSKPNIDKLYEAIKMFHESEGHVDGKGLDLIVDPQVTFQPFGAYRGFLKHSGAFT